MKTLLSPHVSLIVSFLLSICISNPAMRKGISPKSLQQPVSEKALFDSDHIMTITLKGQTKELINDRSENPQYHPFVFSFYNEDSTAVEFPVEIRTRGHFRKLRENCNYPPLMIQFPKQGKHLSTVFREQSKLKLVVPCVSDEYVVREWLVYKIYNLVTPMSFRARLVRIKLEDSRTGKSIASFYGIFLEEEKQVAKRNKATSIEQQLRPEQTKPDVFLTMAVFEYLIGNTDWSVQYMQNIKLLMPDGDPVPITVPYDFDHAGIVNAPYARPAEELLMRSVRERRYRGYCVRDLKVFEPVISKFNQVRNEIHNLYTSNTLLDPKYIKATTRYLDEFYATINNPKSWQRDFAYPCDKNGTGNVVTKGLRED